MTYNVKWGILATGGIAQTFAKDILTNPACRNVTDVSHTVVAAASSTSQSRAEEFLKDIGASSDAKAYGSYHELVNDPNIDVVYVATPHSHHFQNAMLVLEAGKNVLCEKAFTVNAKQARALVAKAKEKNVFLMEAVWTRYFPLSIAVRELVRNKTIGAVKRVVADLSVIDTKDGGKTVWDEKHRMVNMDLAGGSLLDLGIYALTWNFQILYHCQAEQDEKRERPRVLAAINPYDVTGCDENTAIILQFPEHQTIGIATSGLKMRSNIGDYAESGASIRIQGTSGEIQIKGPAFRPIGYRLIVREGEENIVKDFDCEIPGDPDRGGWGHGMFWEADEVARCLRDGKKQSESLTWAESVIIMETMDEVRKQGGLVYPDLIESDVYDEKSPLNG